MLHPARAAGPPFVSAFSAVCVAMLGSYRLPRLRVQRFDPPARSVADVEVARVEAARLADPEFDSVRHEAKAGPMRRSRDRPSGEPRLELGEASIQVARVGDRFALS